MKTNSEYRQRGRELTKGKIFNIFIITLVFSVVVGIVTGLGTPFGPTLDPDTFVIIDAGNPALVQLFNLLGLALSGYVTYSLLKMFIRVTQNQQPVIEETLLEGVKEQPVKAPVLALLSSLLIGLWSLLFIIPGIIKSYSYAMGTYLLIKNKDISAMDAITQSRKLMDGKKLQLFMLDLSYLGWYILSLFTLGILAIWVSAWHQTARALFYQDVEHSKNDR